MTDRRFDRQVLFAPLGPQGQQRLAKRRVLLVGCGALGSSLAQSLVRSGVGTLVLVDRDVVEETNLPRQVLFEERHAREGALKAQATREALARIGGPTRIEAHAEHLDADNIEELAAGCDLVLDGTDNLGTRYLLNDWAVREGVPWVYGGVVGSGGIALAVLPGRGPCLRCLFPDPPPAGALETCDTAGVLQPAVAAIAGFQAGLALRILAAVHPAECDLEPRVIELDVWRGEARALALARRPDCPCCAERAFPFLEEPLGRRATILCGRNAVQVRGPASAPSLEEVERRVAGLARQTRRAGPILRFDLEECRVTLFQDGRALIEGTDQVERALALYDRFVGS